MKTCKKCGAINSDDSSYCSTCDAKLPKTTDQPTKKEERAAAEKASEQAQDKVWQNAQDVAVDIKINVKQERFFEEETLENKEQSELKICNKCGAYVSSDKNTCPDCGNFLTDDADKNVNKKLNKQLEKLANASDPFYPKMWEKILGYFSLVGAVFLGIMMLVSIFFEKFNSLYIVGIIIFADAYLNALHIEGMWYLKQLGMAFTVDHPEDLTPSVLWTYGRKAGIILCAAAGTVFAVFALNGLFYQL